MLCPDFILGTPHRIYTRSMIKNINIPVGAGSPKSRKSRADIGKPALRNCGMILIALWDGRPARPLYFHSRRDG
jgi:hypothetical protein